MKIIEIRPREIDFVLWGHCQNLLDGSRTFQILNMILYNLFTVEEQVI